jgi:hypothetical protein
MYDCMTCLVLYIQMSGIQYSISIHCTVKLIVTVKNGIQGFIMFKQHPSS